MVTAGHDSSSRDMIRKFDNLEILMRIEICSLNFKHYGHGSLVAHNWFEFTSI